MDRRLFIRNTGLAAALSGFAPSFAMRNIFPGQRKNIYFILRAVGYTDALYSFIKYSTPLKGQFSLKKVTCLNPQFSHEKGVNELMNGKNSEILFTQNMDRYAIQQVVKDALNTSAAEIFVHLHHTEIGHSSEKDFVNCLDIFFQELSCSFDASQHSVIVTADIGRNAFENSCGGRDHSDETALETFALYLGKDKADKSLNYGTLEQNMVFSI